MFTVKILDPLLIHLERLFIKLAGIVHQAQDPIFTGKNNRPQLSVWNLAIPPKEDFANPCRLPFIDDKNDASLIGLVLVSNDSIIDTDRVIILFTI